jgi:hypothetical protein
MESSNLDRKKRMEWSSIIGIVVVLIIAISIFNMFILSGMSGTISGEVSKIGEENRPADITISVISYSDCADCYDIGQAVSEIKTFNVKTENEVTLQWDSPEAQSLISKYSINALPALVITGETTKSNVRSSLEGFGGFQDDGSVIFTAPVLPYYDVSQEKILGIVSIITVKDSSCAQCIDMEGLTNIFKESGVTVAEEKVLEYDSPEGSDLVARFGIKEVPTLVVSGDITDYASINQLWDQLITVEKEGFYVIPAVQSPYRVIDTGEITGLVRLVNLVDSSCTDCYDVSAHAPVIARLGVAVNQTETHDISSAQGKTLLAKYGITKVPTILLSPEASVYVMLNQVWSQVGTVESDGWYVFREMSSLGEVKYSDV